VDIQISSSTFKHSTPNDLLGPIERSKKKNENVITPIQNLPTRLSLLKVNFEIQDTLLVAQMDINHEWNNKVKIFNLKIL